MEDREFYTKVIVNESRIEDIEKDLEKNSNILNEVKDSLFSFRLETKSQLENIKEEVHEIKASSSINWSKIITKENLSLIVAATITINIMVTSFKGGSTNDQIDSLLKVLQQNE